MLRALKDIHYEGWTSIFMHPVPRGAPILPKAGEVTDLVNAARDYLETVLAQL